MDKLQISEIHKAGQDLFRLGALEISVLQIYDGNQAAQKLEQVHRDYTAFLDSEDPIYLNNLVETIDSIDHLIHTYEDERPEVKEFIQDRYDAVDSARRELTSLISELR